MVLWLEKTSMTSKGKDTAVPSMVISGVSSPFTSPVRVVCPPQKARERVSMMVVPLRSGQR